MALLSRWKAFAVAAVLVVSMAGAAAASTVTGDPQINGFGWVPNSTNALNYAQLTPGHVGQTTPYVAFDSNTAGSVTLNFFNLAPGLAFFETRIDGIETGTTAHPIVIGDTIHTGGTAVATGTSLLGKIFTATNFVDIRLALGGEADYRFDWTRFNVAAVPLPAGLPLLAGGVGLLAVFGMKRKRTAAHA